MNNNPIHIMHLANIACKAATLPTRYRIIVQRDEETRQLTGAVAFLPKSASDTCPPWGYVANVTEGTCECLGFQKSGTCSHLIAAEGYYNDEAEAEAQEMAEDDRFFLSECAALHASEAWALYS